MPLFYQQNINATTRLAIWKIEESEIFFSDTIPLQREITHPHKRLQHLAGRYLLRFLFPSFPYSDIQIAATKKPFLTNEQFHFSISHCADYAVAIVSSTHRVGIDIEVPSEKVVRIAHKFLSEKEIANFKFPISNQPINQLTNPLNKPINQLTNNPINQSTNKLINTIPQYPNQPINQSTNKLINPIPQLTLLWSAKEAIFKWWGNGEVDFSEMIQLENFELETRGSFNASFQQTALQMHYEMFDKLCLAWVITN